MFRNYPTIKDSDLRSNFNCSTYDPRYRGWYTQAITGNKNVILMVDNSGELEKQFDTIKKAAISLAKTFIIDDKVGAFGFNDQVAPLSNNSIVKINQFGKDDLVSKIEKLTADNGSDIIAAFNKAFAMLNAEKDSEGLCCRYGS